MVSINGNLQVSLSDSSKKVDGIDDIVQCIYAIVTTVKGSDPLRPDFGSDFSLYIDKPMQDVQPVLIYSVWQALERWEIRITVNAIRLVPEGLDRRRIEVDFTVMGWNFFTVKIYN